MDSTTHRQTTDTVLMVRPARFGWNAETAVTNTHQQADGSRSAEAIQADAAAEHDGLVAALRGAGVTVVVVDDTESPLTPDAIFPNNWFSTHDDGTLVLYPMATPNRRAERRADVVDRLADEHGLRTVLDLTRHERTGRVLEGTGSLVLDRVNGVAYLCVSQRSDPGLFAEWARRMGYSRSVAFHATEASGEPVYHTNVVMAVGARTAVVCAEAIASDDERRAVMESLASTGHAVVAITRAQMNGFAGNLLLVGTRSGDAVWAMSTAAHDALTEEQRAVLRRDGALVHAPIPTIERIGGGSVRCTIAEIFPGRARAPA